MRTPAAVARPLHWGYARNSVWRMKFLNRSTHQRYRVCRLQAHLGIWHSLGAARTHGISETNARFFIFLVVRTTWGAEVRQSRLPFLSKWNKWMEIDGKQRACDLLLATAAIADDVICAVCGFRVLLCVMSYVRMDGVWNERSARVVLHSLPSKQLIKFRVEFSFFFFFGISVSCSAWNMRNKIWGEHTHTRREQASCTHWHDRTPKANGIHCN